MQRSFSQLREVSMANSFNTRSTTSRGLLWVALSAFALPFLFEATSGCSFKTIPAGEPIDDNAYTCACNCDESRTVSIAVAASSDDAEQATGNMFLTNPNLNLAAIPAGLRFPAVTIPQGAVIQSAFVQFTADANNTEASTMQIVAQLSPNAPTFSTTPNDLSSRPATIASVAWTRGWWVAGSAGQDQRTPNLAALIQELVNQPGWSAASPVVLRITGNGRRVAESFDGNRARAAVLQVVFDG